MASDLGEPFPLDPEPNERELDTQRLDLEPPGPSLVDADPFLLGMRMANLIYAAVFGIVRIER
jgi:hypothetical protein